MAPADPVGPRDEYQSLRSELADSKRYVFERPLLIAAGGLTAVGAFKVDTEYVAVVPIVIVGLLVFNLWFTANRLVSAGRIIAYIQLQLEAPRVAPWQGWETSLREYRKWIKRPQARETVDHELDREAVPDGFLYYPAIYKLHLGIAALAVVSSGWFAFGSSHFVPNVCAIGTLLLAMAFGVSATRRRPGKLATTIERNRVIWLHVLKEMPVNQPPQPSSEGAAARPA
ncbi:MAG TPA: hypothetical protein VMW75_12310 [Thermoanaerobaculia bacterium]|nr:hypothetical protein [Thermoanaerobaculia bacterium]